jgi:hypothetical protein
MNLDLTEEEAAALLRELNGIIDGDRYFLSPRIKTMKAIRAKLRPDPSRGPLPPPPKQYAPPRATAARRRRSGRRGAVASRLVSCNCCVGYGLSSASAPFPFILRLGFSDCLPLHVGDGIGSAAGERYDVILPVTKTGTGR